MNDLLRGRDHIELDRIAASTVTPTLAIALSRGRVPKNYDYTDPNEDVVAVTRDARSTALIVADGHNGLRGSDLAVDAVLESMADGIPVHDKRHAVFAFLAVNETLNTSRRAFEPSNRRTRTTLSVATITIEDAGQRFLTHATVGDSPVLVVRDRSVFRISKDRHRFLGDRLSGPQVAGSMDYGQTDLAPQDIVVVVTDGYTNFARARDIGRLLQPTPEATARRIIDHAGECGAGDNVAVAVLFPETMSLSTHG